MKSVPFSRPDGKPLLIEIIHYQMNAESRNQTPGRHRHEFNSLFFYQAGQSVQEVDFEEYSFGTNDLMFIPKNAIHWEKSSKSLKGYVILFTDEFFSEPQMVLLKGFLEYAQLTQKLHLKLSEAQVNELIHYFELLKIAQESENQNQVFILQNLMLALLNSLEAYIQELESPNSFIRQRFLFQQFSALIEGAYQQEKRVKFYAEKLKCTTKKLNQAVSEVTGKTVQEVIIEKVLLEGKRKLCFSGLSVKEVAFESGYENQFYFSRLFKNKLGLSPEEFRGQFAQ